MPVRFIWCLCKKYEVSKDRKYPGITWYVTYTMYAVLPIRYVYNICTHMHTHTHTHTRTHAHTHAHTHTQEGLYREQLRLSQELQTESARVQEQRTEVKGQLETANSSRQSLDEKLQRLQKENTQLQVCVMV